MPVPGRPNPIKDKSFAFAVKMVGLHRDLAQDKKEFILSKQILRSGTSIGANVEEAQSAISTADFLHRISIAFKEAKETHCWLRLLTSTGYLAKDRFAMLISDCEELRKLLFAILKTTRIKKQPTRAQSH